MKNRIILITLVVAVALCLVMASLAIEARITGSYLRGGFEVAQREVSELATLIPADLTPEKLAHIAQQRGVKFRTLSAADYSRPPQGSHTVCFYGTFTFFFGLDARPLELHGPYHERDPLYQWR